MTIVPILRYRNPDAAAAWLCGAFGFEYRLLKEEDGRVVHALLKFGNMLVVIATDGVRDLGGNHISLTLKGFHARLHLVIPRDDVDRHCAHARAQGAVIVTEPRNLPVGGREYRCLDLESNLWSVGTSPAADPLSLSAESED